MLEMVFCFQNCSDLLWEKSDREIFLEFKVEGQDVAIFSRSLSRTIYFNSERSEQFLKKECLFKFVFGGFSVLIR
jgi:hypothetical protein